MMRYLISFVSVSRASKGMAERFGFEAFVFELSYRTDPPIVTAGFSLHVRVSLPAGKFYHRVSIFILF